jgi:hypothetical protein
VCKHKKVNTRTYGGGEKYCEFMSFEGVKGCNEKYFVTRHNSREEKENKLEIK